MFKTDEFKIILTIFFDTESETFMIPNISDTESDTFFDTKYFPIPNPILFLIPNISDTESDTFLYQICSIPNPIPLKNRKSFEIEMSHSALNPKLLD